MVILHFRLAVGDLPKLGSAGYQDTLSTFKRRLFGR